MARINIVNADNKIESNPRRAYFKLKNTGGPKGDTGAQGPQGPKGDTGAQGPAGLSASVTVGSTTTLAPGASATVTNSGDTRNAVLNFGIPTGAQGPQGVQGPKGDTGPEGAKGAKGDTGAAATVTVANTNTGAPGTNASVENVGDEHNAVLNFTIPRGDKGETGATGAQGEQGPAGKDFTPTVVTALPETGENGVLYMTEKAHTTQTATGNHITATITDGAGKMEAFQLDGDTFQQSYTGKNLLNIDAATVKADRGITATIPKDGTITLTGTAISTGNAVVTERYDFAQAWPAGTYTFSIQQPLTRQFYIHFILAGNSTQNIVLTAGQTSASGTFTQALKAYDLRFNVTSGESYNETTTLMVEAGEEATSYEPYCGGQPSPNPDYPQTIRTVTGAQTVTVTGKNLFNKDASTVGYYLDSSGAMIASTAWVVSEYIPVKEGQKYTISGVGIVGALPKSCFYDSSKTFVSSFANGNQTITIPSGVSFMRASVFAGNAGSPSDLLTYMLELGESATAYAPYSKQTFSLNLGTIELCKLGTYQDYIWKDGESWKVHNANGKTVITDKNARGSFQSSTDTSRFAFGGITPQGTPQGTNAELCSKLERKFNWNTDVQGFYANGSTIVARIAHGIVGNTEESFATWLESNPLTIYYALATATDTTITDAGLIAQLEAIRTALLQNGANTITNTATGSNLAGDMEIGYYGYTPSSQYDKWLWLDVGAAGAHYEQI